MRRGGDRKRDQIAIAKLEQQQDQSVQDTMPPPSPPHVTITPADTITVKDVTNKSCHNINPITIEDLSKIFDQSTQQARLCTNPILVNVDEFKKAIVNPIRVKVKPQRPPFVSIATITQILLLPPPSPTIVEH